jgi:hypothetical protein
MSSGVFPRALKLTAEADPLVLSPVTSTWTYPEATADEDKLLLLEHADDSAVTVLAQQGDYEGLQIQGPTGAGPADSDAQPVLVWDQVKDRVADYLSEYGRSEQVAAWRDGQPYVAELAENSPGR